MLDNPTKEINTTAFHGSNEDEEVSGSSHSTIISRRKRVEGKVKRLAHSLRNSSTTASTTNATLKDVRGEENDDNVTQKQTNNIREDYPLADTSTTSTPNFSSRLFCAWFLEKSTSCCSCGRNDERRDYVSESSTRIRVDPKDILRLLSEHGGQVLPTRLVQDLQVFYKVGNSDVAFLDLVKRQLELRNLTITPASARPDEISKNCTSSAGPALKVGKAVVQWDSYQKPCLDVNLDDVFVTVEFTNFLLSRNNWDELRDEGFPPKREQGTSHESEKIFRIGSIDFTGDCAVNVRSRPLDRSILTSDEILAKTADELSRRIRESSDRAKDVHGCRGCTPEEIRLIISSYFWDKLGEKLREKASKFEEKVRLSSTAAPKVVATVPKKVTRVANVSVNKLRNSAEKLEGKVKESSRAQKIATKASSVKNKAKQAKAKAKAKAQVVGRHRHSNDGQHQDNDEKEYSTHCDDESREEIQPDTEATTP